MSIFLIVIHIIVCIALILIVLLQTGKGSDMGAAFGGGSSHTVFGSSGASTFLSKATTVAAVVFMITSLGLAYKSGHKTGDSILMETAPAPIEQKAVTENPIDANKQAEAPAVTGEQTSGE